MAALHARRDPALCARDLERYRARNPHLFPKIEPSVDPNRGQLRFAAEVMLSEFSGIEVPKPALERAIDILIQIAKD